MYYISSDHLGSINLIVDGSNGNVVDDLSYDSWGRNRNPIDWSPSNITLSSITDRGYTSHEQLTNFGLINMNGRVYDPMTLGFLSPDPFVQNPSNSQNYNRFSYVLNNPLKYVDPSGYVALNPWYEYQAGPKTKFYTWMPDFHEEYLDNQGRNWKYKGENINTRGFYGDETGMWISKLNEYDELIYSYNELRQIVQNNANSNSFFSSFSSGAGTLRVEGEVGRGNEPSKENNLSNVSHIIGTISLAYSFWQNKIYDGENYRPSKGPNAGKLTSVWKMNKSGNFATRNGFKIPNSGKAALKILETNNIKIGGIIFTTIGLGFTIYDINQNGLNLSNGSDFAMGMVAYVPGWGWAVSGGYFIGKEAYYVYPSIPNEYWGRPGTGFSR
ncbi:MAG: hypothetical protein PHU27_07235 [Salinivirgaceae bacterium]|nr:hypothetical protein [Salinivirgaceae bacterium]